MEISRGDWVQIPTGELGKVILVSRLTAYVELQTGQIANFLVSQLTKTEPPPEPTK